MLAYGYLSYLLSISSCLVGEDCEDNRNAHKAPNLLAHNRMYNAL